MSLAIRIPLLALALSAAAACADGDAAPDPPRAVSVPPDTLAPAEWRASPSEGVAIRPNGILVVETGPHAVLWPSGAPDLAPPYTVRAALNKRAGRLNEGYGLVFGGTGLDGAEEGQAYSYFLVRGDGSFLVKRRDGAATPVVVDWTRHAAVQRDGEEGGRNELAVEVGADTVAFQVNGETVARVPAEALSVRGRAGVRVAHDVVLEVESFAAAADGP